MEQLWDGPWGGFRCLFLPLISELLELLLLHFCCMGSAPCQLQGCQRRRSSTEPQLNVPLLLLTLSLPAHPLRLASGRRNRSSALPGLGKVLPLFFICSSPSLLQRKSWGNSGLGTSNLTQEMFLYQSNSSSTLSCSSEDCPVYYFIYRWLVVLEVCFWAIVLAHFFSSIEECYVYYFILFIGSSGSLVLRKEGTAAVSGVNEEGKWTQARETLGLRAGASGRAVSQQPMRDFQSPLAQLQPDQLHEDWGWLGWNLGVSDC